ncbi:aldehyde dehydrogenase (NADP(+)) [Geothrix sp. PMB-07]|uniref:aldehyde dehydrogenase (NADP(+)) n=1 Tax=Geothrix sp. PMB-07 TaxID=3068640 RepID=UPI002740D891|nr:aldehyde dehydrogenase (NADP(+)) [Geothrix sp. PMB-07]WLT30942.1 aldehyde dehydrogenase (NADP(+)) [Geothrix sp. PMB-07]
MIHGFSLIGSASGGANGTTFQAQNPASGERLDPPFHSASDAEVDRAVELARAAGPVLEAAPREARSALLRRIAEGLEEAAGELVPRVMAETALPEPRVRGELARTCGQLRLFADVAAEGSWVEARLDSGNPDRTPLPKPDLRSMLQPLGPVAVFGASNFPLAFGAVGGDTASAFAAGCPVVAKAHPLNPGTSELVAQVVQAALLGVGLPAGAFSLLFDAGHGVARRLVEHPAIRAVGFTGSFHGGMALLELARNRPDPIPVFAEMGAANPVVALPGALAARGAALGQTLAASVLNGVGQFCTCPGIILAVQGPGFQALRSSLAEAMAAAAPAPMLGEGLARSYRLGLERHLSAGAVPVFSSQPSQGCFGAPALMETSGQELLRLPGLTEEVFGPTALLVACADETERERAIAALPAQLTATLWMEPEDEALAVRLLPSLRRLAGRVLFNGVPTGVEVGHAMVHGGPWPATSAQQATSVGTRAITRWTRPICYQDAPETLLPLELQAGNPLGIWRLYDGVFGRR